MAFYLHSTKSEFFSFELLILKFFKRHSNLNFPWSSLFLLFNLLFRLKLLYRPNWYQITGGDNMVAMSRGFCYNFFLSIFESCLMTSKLFMFVWIAVLYHWCKPHIYIYSTYVYCQTGYLHLGLKTGSSFKS